MEDLPRKTRKEMEEELRPCRYLTDQVEIGPYEINEEIWGLKEEIYAPLGIIRLPVFFQALPVEKETNGYCVVALTIFDSPFFDGVYSHKSYDDQKELAHLIWYGDSSIVIRDAVRNIDLIRDPSDFDGLYDRSLMVTGNNENNSPDTAIREHASNFFRLYNMTKNLDVNNSVVRHIRKGFQEYRVGEGERGEMLK